MPPTAESKPESPRRRCTCYHNSLNVQQKKDIIILTIVQSGWPSKCSCLAPGIRYNYGCVPKKSIFRYFHPHPCMQWMIPNGSNQLICLPVGFPAGPPSKCPELGHVSGVPAGVSKRSLVTPCPGERHVEHFSVG